jgi:Fe2+ transport system protein FeoA
LQLSLSCSTLPGVSETPEETASFNGSLEPGCLSLDSVKAGTAVRIKSLSATPEISNRLREMGFCEEQRIRLLLKHTNIVCQVCNARLGISPQLAKNIIVEPVSGPRRKAA